MEKEPIFTPDPIRELIINLANQKTEEQLLSKRIKELGADIQRKQSVMIDLVKAQENWIRERNEAREFCLALGIQWSQDPWTQESDHEEIAKKFWSPDKWKETGLTEADLQSLDERLGEVKPKFRKPLLEALEKGKKASEIRHLYQHDPKAEIKRGDEDGV